MNLFVFQVPCIPNFPIQTIFHKTSLPYRPALPIRQQNVSNSVQYDMRIFLTEATGYSVNGIRPTPNLNTINPNLNTRQNTFYLNFAL